MEAMKTLDIKTDDVLQEIVRELDRAQDKFPAFHSLHEAYAVILEEVDELWEITRQRKSNKMGFHGREECIQIAAMAIRAILDRRLT